MDIDNTWTQIHTLWDMAGVSFAGIQTDMFSIFFMLATCMFLIIGGQVIHRIFTRGIGSFSDSEMDDVTPQNKKRIFNYRRTSNDDEYDVMGLSSDSIMNNNKGSWNDHAGDRRDKYGHSDSPYNREG